MGVVHFPDEARVIPEPAKWLILELFSKDQKADQTQNLFLITTLLHLISLEIDNSYRTRNVWLKNSLCCTRRNSKNHQSGLKSIESNIKNDESMKKSK
jgi:hypothetical protein